MIIRLTFIGIDPDHPWAADLKTDDGTVIFLPHALLPPGTKVGDGLTCILVSEEEGRRLREIEMLDAVRNLKREPT